jgi:PEP-CTERM motif
MNKAVMILAATAGAALATVASAQVQLQEVGRVAITSGGTFGSNTSAVAWNGTDLYVSGFSAGGGTTSIQRVSNALTTPTVSSFGSLATIAGRGYTGLAISNTAGGGTLVASWDNGSNSGNSLQTFNLDATNTLRWNAGSPGSLGTTNRGFAGPGIDPGFVSGGGAGGVAFAVQGSGTERLMNVATGAAAGSSGFIAGNWAAANAPSPLPTGGNTAYRDLTFDPATGDVYTRTNNGVQRGARTANYQFDGNSGALPWLWAPTATGNNVSTNIGFMNTNLFGNVLVFNDRSTTGGGQSFFAKNIITTTTGAVQTVSWLAPDGVSTFVPVNTGNAGYDYSFDSATQTLAVSDFNNNTVYIFQVVPAPSTLALLGLGGLVAGRRRR